MTVDAERDELNRISFLVEARRQKLLQSILTVYPLNKSGRDKNSIYSIRELVVPRVEDMGSYEEDLQKLCSSSRRTYHSLGLPQWHP